ncbi:MAG: hypothetical protein ABIH50_05675 [bacterium]
MKTGIIFRQFRTGVTIRKKGCWQDDNKGYLRNTSERRIPAVDRLVMVNQLPTSVSAINALRGPNEKLFAIVGHVADNITLEEALKIVNNRSSQHLYTYETRRNLKKQN